MDTTGNLEAPTGRHDGQRRRSSISYEFPGRRAGRIAQAHKRDPVAQPGDGHINRKAARDAAQRLTRIQQRTCEGRARRDASGIR
jgi:hypothetical protein